MNCDNVKTWRKKTKQRIIEAMGGCCVICGYNKCDSVLSLHHLDPSKKEMSFGDIRANPVKWETIVKELKKCILICSNCHGEIHYGYIKLSDTIKSSYNINYVYTKNERINWSDYDVEKMYVEKGIYRASNDIGCTYTTFKKKLIRMGIIKQCAVAERTCACLLSKNK
jgi:hypothetical protein